MSLADRIEAEPIRPAGAAGSGLRARLLTVTADLLAADGLEALSLREIARRAGVSHGAPLRHFPSLAALLSNIAAEGFRRLFGEVDQAVTAAGEAAAPRRRLVAAAHAYTSFALANPGHFTLMFRPDLLDPDVAEFAGAAAAAFEQLVALVRDLQTTGWQPNLDPVDLAGALWSAVHGLTSLWLQGAMQGATGAPAIDGIFETLLTVVLDGGSATAQTSRPSRRRSLRP